MDPLVHNIRMVSSFSEKKTQMFERTNCDCNGSNVFFKRALLHLPSDYYTSNTYYPLIFFHHGLGEGSPNGLESDLSIVLGQSGVCTEIYQGSNVSC